MENRIASVGRACHPAGDGGVRGSSRVWFDFSMESMQDSCRYVFWCGMGAKRHVESDVRPQDEDGTAQEDRSRLAGVAAARRFAKAREMCVLDQFIEK